MTFTKIFFVVAALIFANVVLCHPDADRHANVGIIGGHHILIEQAPYMVSLRLNGTYHWCGGSIIHERFILTAAHCIIPNREFKVLVGTDNVNGGGELHDIEEINIPKRYNNKTYDFDICLIKLKTSLTFGPKIAKVTLADRSLKFPKGTKFNTTGWGSTGIDTVSPKLLQVMVPLIRKQECRLIYVVHKYAITSHMICAGNRGHDSCQGDSGGPLTLGNIQVGVTSFGLGCGVMPGVYAKVASVLDWITDKIQMHQ